jgi:chromosome transmission fidelity protein 18
MAATGVRFEKSRIENESAFNKSTSGGWIYRMEPPLDSLGNFDTMKSVDKGVRYAVRQVLEMEWRKRELKKGEETRIKKMAGEDLNDGNNQAKGADLRKAMVKRDFFGRVIREADRPAGPTSTDGSKMVEDGRANDTGESKDGNGRVWVSFHEGFSNAVRKPITLKELMDGM